jgi:hypothetical protein
MSVMDDKKRTPLPAKKPEDVNKSDKQKKQRKSKHIAADSPPEPVAVDRPGFDLGGSTGETSAGTGLGPGEDAAENRQDRSLPGHRGGSTLSIPRWSGAEPAKTSPPKKK